MFILIFSSHSCRFFLNDSMKNETEPSASEIFQTHDGLPNKSLAKCEDKAFTWHCVFRSPFQTLLDL